MDADWSIHVLKRIDRLTVDLGQARLKSLRVQLLRRVAVRIDGFALDRCSDCDALRQAVLSLVEQLELVAQADAGLDRRQYRAGLSQLLGHLRTKHRLVEPGTYLSQWIAIGLMLGAALQTLGSAYIGVGLCLGAAVGSAWDAQAKREGRLL